MLARDLPCLLVFSVGSEGGSLPCSGEHREVVELKDIEKELVLTQARLKLVKFSSSTELSLPVAPGLSPAETVALLAAANLFWD